MKTREIDYEVLKDWEDRLDQAYRILEVYRDAEHWTLVCDEALRDLNAVRREIDCEILETVTEEMK